MEDFIEHKEDSFRLREFLREIWDLLDFNTIFDIPNKLKPKEFEQKPPFKMSEISREEWSELPHGFEVGGAYFYFLGEDGETLEISVSAIKKAAQVKDQELFEFCNKLQEKNIKWIKGEFFVGAQQVLWELANITGQEKEEQRKRCISRHCFQIENEAEKFQFLSALVLLAKRGDHFPNRYSLD